MATLTLCIGNSDDKLSQREWAAFWHAAGDVVSLFSASLHGVFLSQPNAAYQNACWVFEGELTDELRAELAGLASRFRQVAIAVVVGTSELVSAADR